MCGADLQGDSDIIDVAVMALRDIGGMEKPYVERDSEDSRVLVDEASHIILPADEKHAEEDTVLQKVVLLLARCDEQTTRFCWMHVLDPLESFSERYGRLLYEMAEAMLVLVSELIQIAQALKAAVDGAKDIGPAMKCLSGSVEGGLDIKSR